MKICPKCKIKLSSMHFGKDKSQKSGLRPYCKKCECIRAKKYHAENRDKCLDTMKRSSAKTKDAVFMAYGGYICACCGETNRGFLTLDHINGGGRKHLKESLKHGGNSFYSYLKKNNFPPGLRVMCYNCNCGRQHNHGICPHIIEGK